MRAQLFKVNGVSSGGFCRKMGRLYNFASSIFQQNILAYLKLCNTRRLKKFVTNFVTNFVNYIEQLGPDCLVIYDVSSQRFHTFSLKESLFICQRPISSPLLT